jgi:hypothetical protein
MEALLIDGPMDRTRMQVEHRRPIQFMALSDPVQVTDPALPVECSTHTYLPLGYETAGGTTLFVWDNPQRLRMNGVPE